MKRIAWVPVLLILLRPVPGEARSVIQEKDGVRLQIDADDTVRLSDTIRATVTITGSASLIVESVGETPPDASWSLVERSPVRREKIDDTRLQWSVTCSFAPQEPGEKVPFTFPALRYRDGAGVHTITFAPVDIKVVTRIGEADLDQMHDITSIEPTPPNAAVDFSWVVGIALTGWSFAILLVVLLTMRWLRRKVPPSQASRSLQEWHRLMALRLPEKGKGERFVTLLSRLVRTYLERQFALPARRRTTQEAVAGVANCVALTSEEKQLLTAFLERCEFVKFANEEMPSVECDRWAAEVRALLEKRATQDS